jgi:hypothetical protein
LFTSFSLAFSTDKSALVAGKNWATTVSLLPLVEGMVAFIVVD